MVMRIFGQMFLFPVAFFARWMDALATVLEAAETVPEREAAWGNEGNQLWALAEGAVTQEGKEEKKMSKCCCDNEHGVVKLVEYTIVSIKRCDERILYKSEIIETEEMSDEAFATWVVALYLQEPGVHVPHDDKKFLRVYHHTLETWPRQKEGCCEDREVHVLRGIEEAIRSLTRHVGGGREGAAALS